MTNKITRNATTTTATNGNNASSVQMYAKVLAPNGDKELAKVKRPVKTTTKTVATKALPVADNAALEIRLNALASMLRGLNDRIDALEFVHIGTYADDMASVRCDISELKAALTVPALNVPALSVPALTDASPFETAASCAIANYHAGYVNDKIRDAALKMGKAENARWFLKTAENRALKLAGKAMELSLDEIEKALDALVFDA